MQTKSMSLSGVKIKLNWGTRHIKPSRLLEKLVGTYCARDSEATGKVQGTSGYVAKAAENGTCERKPEGRNDERTVRNEMEHLFLERTFPGVFRAPNRSRVLGIGGPSD
jgi:hypothetical protein